MSSLRMSISNSQRDRSCERIDEKDETTAATGDDWEDADVKVTFVSKHDEEEMGKHFRYEHYFTDSQCFSIGTD